MSVCRLITLPAAPLNVMCTCAPGWTGKSYQRSWPCVYMLVATELLCEPVAVSAHNCAAVSQESLPCTAVMHDDKGEAGPDVPSTVAAICVPAVLVDPCTVGENAAAPDP